MLNQVVPRIHFKLEPLMCHKWELLQNAKYKYYSTNELLMCEFLPIQTNLSTPRSQEKLGKDVLETNLLSSSPDPQDPIGWSFRQVQYRSHCSIKAKPDRPREPWAAMRESRKESWEKAGKGQLPVRHMHPTLFHTPSCHHANPTGNMSFQLERTSLCHLHQISHDAITHAKQELHCPFFLCLLDKTDLQLLGM